MIPLVSVDPGKRQLAVALWGERLERAALLPLAEPWHAGAVLVAWLGAIEPWSLAVELPQIYTRTKSKGDPNDLIPLAVAVGACASRCPLDVTTYLPASWKGQTPKHATLARLEMQLSDGEWRVIRSCNVRAGLLHNVVDAVGIGHRHRKKPKKSTP